MSTVAEASRIWPISTPRRRTGPYLANRCRERKRKSGLAKEDLPSIIRLSDPFKNIYGRSNSNSSTKQFPLSQICTFPGLRSQAEEFISLVINGDSCGRDGAKPTNPLSFQCGEELIENLIRDGVTMINPPCKRTEHHALWPPPPLSTTREFVWMTF